MDQSTALNKLLEASDLVRMLEDLTAPANFARLSSGAVSGLRITLRSLREGILASHDCLAAEVVARAKANSSSAGTDLTSGAKPDVTPTFRSATAVLEGDPLVMRRKDLRSSLESSVDRS